MGACEHILIPIVLTMSWQTYGRRQIVLFVAGTFTVGSPVEVGDGPVLCVLGCRGESVAFDVVDEPIHFENLSALSFADFHGELADSHVLNLRSF